MKILLRRFLPPALAALLSALTLRAQTTVPADNASLLPAEVDLPAALRYALGHNFSILQARESIKEQEGVIVETMAAVLPGVAVNSQYGDTSSRLQVKFPGQPAENNQAWSITLEATQALFAGGKFSAAIHGAKALRQAALYQMQGAINDALLDVRTKFYEVLLNQEQIKVQEENLALLEQQARDAQSRYDAGTGAHYDLLSAQVALANGQPPLIQARNNYRIALEQLRQSLGLVSSGSSAPLQLTGSLDHPPEQFDLESALAAARTNRPELLRYAQLQAAQEQNVKVARADYWPTLSAFGGYRVINNPLVTDLGSTKDGWLLGVQSSWAVFDGRATAGRVAQAKSQVEQARLTLLDEQLTVEVEVRQAYSSFEEASELVKASAKTVEQAQEALREARIRYSAGTIAQLDVLNAQVQLTTARTNLVQADYNYEVAVATLRRAMGVADKFELRD